MKIIILMLILSILSVNISAQSFLNNDKIWSVYQLTDGEIQPKTQYNKFKDTVTFNLKSYVKTYRSYNLNEWSTSNFLLREDSNRVYCTFYDDTLKESLLYDFNLKKGDYYYQLWDQETQYQPYIIDSVITRNVLGINRKHWYFSDAEWEKPNYTVAEVWIEGIGSLTGPLKPIGINNVGAIVKLICVSEGDAQIYQNPGFAGCEATTLSAPVIKKSQNLIKIYSTENGVIKLKLKNEIKGEICLFGIDGRRIASRKINNTETEIGVPMKGLMLYRFINKNAEIQAGKVVVR